MYYETYSCATCYDVPQEVLVAGFSDIQRVKKDLEVHANSRRLLGWNVLCRCCTVAKVRLREYGYLRCFMRKPRSYVPLPLLPVGLCCCKIFQRNTYLWSMKSLFKSK